MKLIMIVWDIREHKENAIWQNLNYQTVVDYAHRQGDDK